MEYAECRRRQMYHLLTLVSAASDLVNAVHWMPVGHNGSIGHLWPPPLWQNSLRPWQVGLFGLVASFAAIWRDANYAKAIGHV